MLTRRRFLNTAATATAGTAIASSARSYAQILGANDRVAFATMGLNGRGKAHLDAIHANKANARMAFCCDPDARVLKKYAAEASGKLGDAPQAIGDFRKALDSREVDAVTIATPDHWHAPMAILALRAGKHVYVEKPSSHNPREGELLIAAQQKYGKLVQVGDQQRSSPHTIKMIGMIHDGLIGRAYYGKAWYSNARKEMGIGKPAAVPDGLDWDLWQGPAPRTAYLDNVHPYNWHWLERYGTGESLNNGTHEVDIARWALNADYPLRVTASGGRYLAKDDWQFPDTLTTSFEYPDQLLSWEGKSSNGLPLFGRERGVAISGTKGSVVMDRQGYEVYNLDGKKTDAFDAGGKGTTRDLVGRDSMTDAHFANLIAGIRKGEPLHSPIAVANVSVTMLQLSNIAWSVNRELTLDPRTGHIQNDPEAMKRWSRTYEKGWDVVV